MSIYLLDANVFIQAKNEYYGFDIMPSFWRWLDDEHARGALFSVMPIVDELTSSGDQLSDWMKSREESWGLRADDPTTQEYFREIVNWVMSNDRFTVPAREKFLDEQDAWLIAKAMGIGATVVTQEADDPAMRRKVGIPAVCRNFRVPFMNTFALMRTLKAQL